MPMTTIVEPSGVANRFKLVLIRSDDVDALDTENSWTKAS